MFTDIYVQNRRFVTRFAATGVKLHWETYEQSLAPFLRIQLCTRICRRICRRCTEIRYTTRIGRRSLARKLLKFFRLLLISLFFYYLLIRVERNKARRIINLALLTTSSAALVHKFRPNYVGATSPPLPNQAYMCA